MREKGEHREEREKENDKIIYYFQRIWPSFKCM